MFIPGEDSFSYRIYNVNDTILGPLYAAFAGVHAPESPLTQWMLEINHTDHEAFSFWEHLYGVSVHKTHEEAWALMQLRRMLWLEAGKELRLLAGIPEAWMDAGQAIEIRDTGSYFGGFDFRLERSGDVLHLQ